MALLAFIHPEGNYNNNPNLSGILTILAENGHTIDLYATKNNSDQSSPHPKIRTLLIPPQHTFQHDAAVVLPSIAQISPFESAKIIAEKMDRPDLIIGVDRGIIEAHALSQALNIPYGLISYEIYFADETSANFKLPEILACKDLSFAIVQDQVRAEQLCRENEINHEKIIYIPVAGRGLQNKEKSFALHDSIGLSRRTKLALYMGEISCTWSGIHEILSHVQDWPEDWALILHHRYGSDAASELAPYLNEQIRKKVFFSPFPTLKQSEMHRLLNSVDAGLAFYTPTPGHPLSNKNLKYIGMASGKIATYLQHGVPVITNEIGLVCDYLKSYQAGAVVKEANELPALLANFNSSGEVFKPQNCHKLFTDKLDLNNTIQPFLSSLQALLGAASDVVSIGLDSPILFTRKWLESPSNKGEVVNTFKSEKRDLSVWKLENTTVTQKAGLIITVDGTVLHESCTEADTAESIKDLRQEKYPLHNPQYIEGEFLNLYGRWSEGFYHWMLEWLPRAYIAESSGFKGKYVIDKLKPFMADSLAILGIDINRIITPPAKIWKPEKLWVCETCGVDELMNFSFVYESIRNKFLCISKKDNSYSRLYITRSNPSRPRRVVNEESLRPLLLKFGFEYVDLEKMPLKQQVDLTANAEAIISPHGAGTIHSLFMKEKSLVVEIFAPNYINPCCLPIMHLLNHRYHPLVSYNTDGKYKFGENIEVPISLLELTLNHELKT